MKKSWVFFALAVTIAITACQMEAEEDDLYPYTVQELVYLGFKPGLTSFSSDEAFDAGLIEVAEAYAASHPVSSNDVVFDGVTYELTDLQSITGGVPNYIVDQYWDAVSEYSYAIGSCWGFVYGEIPSKGGTGTFYVLYTIISYVSSYSPYGDEVRYSVVKGTVKPKSP
jgi:hypothetical protein